ncbi:hypothetical protein ABIB35_002772 [Arthrobacter sp. UYP6]|uniref:hypothetical protein n=1 Tax=Arthrobacter sp. UYP6 TaxID=1756378 RepID=UPI0033944F13
MKRSSLLVCAAVASVAALGAAAELLRRLGRNGVVEQAAKGPAARVSSTYGDTGELPLVSAVPSASATSASALPGWRQSLPVTPVPQDAVTATSAEAVPDEVEPTPGSTETTSDTGLPSRTWMVDNSADWDGSPLELVVPPGTGSHRKPGPGAPDP